MCSTWQLSVPTTGLMHSDHRQPGWNVYRPIWPPATFTSSTVVLSGVRVSSGALKSRCSIPLMACLLLFGSVVRVAGGRARSRLDLSGLLGRQDADALDAEGVGGALGRVGDEPVVRVLLHGVDREARGLDGGAVVVVLHGAADAGGPQVDVAHDRFGELVF